MGKVGKPTEYIGFSTHNNIIIIFNHQTINPITHPHYLLYFLGFYPKNSTTRHPFIPKDWPKELAQNLLLHKAHLPTSSFKRLCQDYVIHYEARLPGLWQSLFGASAKITTFTTWCIYRYYSQAHLLVLWHSLIGASTNIILNHLSYLIILSHTNYLIYPCSTQHICRYGIHIQFNSFKNYIRHSFHTHLK